VKKTGSIATILVIGLVACAEGPTAGAGPAGSEPTSSASPAAEDQPISPLVGEWERETRCEELVVALEEAGMGWAALDFIRGNGFFEPDVMTVDGFADSKDPCAGAIPRVHSHFFTEADAFGSRNWKGEQVDDGMYELLDDDTVVIGEITFDFVIRGDTIRFDPVIPACAVDHCFQAAWAIGVASPGHDWTRVD
jgi:hypothetical protein